VHTVGKGQIVLYLGAKILNTGAYVSNNTDPGVIPDISFYGPSYPQGDLPFFERLSINKLSHN
jgi:hypothetical protein